VATENFIFTLTRPDQKIIFKHPVGTNGLKRILLQGLIRRVFSNTLKRIFASEIEIPR
jgi:hypothetical protein